MTDGRHISEDDLALHAMQALSSAESAVVRSHVAGCAECRELLSAVTGDLALVAASVEQHALPEGARQRLAGRISAAPVPAAQAAPVIPFRGEKTVKRSWTWSSSAWIPWTAVAALLIVT